MINFTLRQIEYLIAAVEHGSIAGAAEKLNISQPTISVAIANLEETCGVQLLIRHQSKGVQLTHQAEEFLQAARAMINQAKALQNIAQSARSEIAGDLRLGCFSALAPTVLPGLIADLAQKHPHINLALKEGAQEQLVADLSDGCIDMALLYDIDLPTSLTTFPLSERMPYAVLGTAHPLVNEPEVSLSDLADDPFILLDIIPSRDYFVRLFHTAGLTPNIAFSSPSLELVRGLVGQNLGYSLLVTRPKGDLTQDGRKLVVKPLKDEIQPSGLVLCHHKNLLESLVMKSFRKVAVDHVDKHW